jgi:predicted ribosome quality control (RQC) complex YloA/Tae2 family protein
MSSTSLWVGQFEDREKDIHSVCRKLRLEIGDRKVEDLFILEKDRTVVFSFRDFYLILECYAKGNVILTDKERKIIVLTRIYGDISHNKVFPEFIVNKEDKIMRFLKTEKGTMIELSEKLLVDNSAISTIEASRMLFGVIKEKATLIKKQKKQKCPQDNIKNQIKEYETKLAKLSEQISLTEDGDTIDFESLGKLHKDRKKIDAKMSRAKTIIDKVTIRVPKIKIDYLVLKTDRWYHAYHWWYTKNGFLVVGGRNADENEKLVKTYLKATDYYFHSDLPGCGSFILFAEKGVPNEIDYEDVAYGVLSLSQQWKMGCGGEVYWVYGNQVSKTPPSGEFICKGSFMINGTRNYIKVSTLGLGYAINEEKELMLAPYRVITRLKCCKEVIKILPKTEAKKANSKKIISLLRQAYSIKDIPKEINIFNFPCNVSIIKRN